MANKNRRGNAGRMSNASTPNEYKQRRAHAQQLREMESRGELPYQQEQREAEAQATKRPRASKSTLVVLVIGVVGLVLNSIGKMWALPGFILCCISFVAGCINIVLEYRKKKNGVTRWAWGAVAVAMFASLVSAMGVNWSQL
ncbi:hypothetical protein [Bifidobacterium gallicum]|uniref:Uncharacterized protein n=1 Tax=Bifidobacterium gallicum DSM 20093 = LMG 11596 TaxID=561180 RepID=D1NW55_9BIFI|nr:hypothetical protein [Bifidobacterium gallicum]EFA22341.1 hypothetical protein BIFGAL_04102 [Bifidobacterium gallicum DSM 20093 = LMG 11596]KFI60054.1 hypothetical protein BGLCM_0074 [Bifidobacterium gallicum DSM 20093 = LMG 11596]